MDTPPPKARSRRLTPLLVIASIGVGIALAFGLMTVAPGISPFGSRSETSNTQVIKAITREEQVVLLGLAIQGINSKSGNGTFFGVNIPWSDRASFIQYSFTAKLGIEGRDVEIEPAGDKKLLISIPRFIFIGHDKPTFKLVVEKNGVLSWVTAEVDQVEMVNNILNDKEQESYIEKNQEALQDQAKVFYTNIIRGIDPSIVLEFQFE